MKIGIIGLGLIGGSFGRELSSQLMVKVYGCDNNPEHVVMAQELRLIHEAKELDDLIQSSDVILVSVPVIPMIGVLRYVLDRISAHQTVIDLGSTKSEICQAVAVHPMRGRYVAAHPLAGTEFSGPEAALKGLFRDKKNIICERDKSDTDALETTLALMESVGLVTSFMNAKDHDMHMAYVSHLSHITSFTLGLTVLDMENDEKQIFNLAGTGFASTARLAKSSPVTWSAIFSQNKEHLIKAIDRYSDWLAKFREAVHTDNIQDMETYMSRANEMKRILK